MIKDNRASKPASPAGRYLLYAIGEIVLVVIGILIALQINNWNETKKENKDLEAVKDNLVKEFNANYHDLENVLESIDYTKTGALDLLGIIGSDINASDDTLNALIEKALFFPTWKPSNYMLKELNNTARLGLIKNDSLKQLLFEWEKEIEVIEEWNRRMEESSQNIVDYIKRYGSIRNINYSRISAEKSTLSVSNIPLLRDVKFENQIDQKALYSQYMENEFLYAKEIIRNILHQIKDR